MLRTKPKKTYECELHYCAVRIVKAKASSREEAIEKASLRGMRLGLEVTTMRVPFFKGDD